MKLYDTMKRGVVDLEPLEPGHVRLYTCGPTVYNFAHIGNYRCYIFEDILRRALKYAGYRVTQVMNLTDIDDKTIRGSREAGVSLKEYTAPYIEGFFEDLKVLNIEAAEHYPAATEHIPEMIDLIGRLLDAGYAYASDDGSVYFNVAKFKGYGKLSHIDVSGLQAGARVAQDEYEKDSVADFALWKAWSEEDGDVAWESPWGRGRPGWHIECSAMSVKYLGESFDLHTGGIDNLFPHHENEIAQSEGATGKPFVKYWMHCAHLQVEGRKMAKSLGNFYTLRDLLDRGYSGREVRYVLLSGHYRQTLNFTFAALDSARAALARLDEFGLRLRELAGDASPGEAPEWVTTGDADFRAAMLDDLNTPEALGAVFEMAHAGNRAMDAGRVTAAEAASACAVLQEVDTVLGVLAAAGDAVPEEIARLVTQRQEAREARDWAESDRIRDLLAGQGWEVRDTPEGAKLRRAH